MQMSAMAAAFAEDVDPETVAMQLRCAEVPVQGDGEVLGGLLEAGLQVGKGRMARGQVIQRGIGRVAGIAFSLSPVMAGRIALFDHPAGLFEGGELAGECGLCVQD